MALDFLARVIRTATPSTTGTVIYSHADFQQEDVIRGVQVVCVRREFDGEDPEANASMCMGFASFDGEDTIRQRCFANGSIDNASTARVMRLGNRTDVVCLLDPVQDFQTVLRAQVTNFDAEGVTINWSVNTAGTNYELILILYGGEECECYAWDETTSGTTNKKVTTGFQPDTVISYTFENIGGIKAHADRGIGFDSRYSPGPNVGAWTAWEDEVATTDGETDTFNTFVHIGVSYTANPFTFGWLYQITNYVADGFDVDSTFNAGNGIDQRCMGLAIRHGNVESATQFRNDPGATGTEAQTWEDFKPGFHEHAMGGSIDPNIPLGFGTMAAGVHDYSLSCHWNITHQVGLATSNANSWVGDDPDFIFHFDDGTTILAAFDVDSRQSNGHTLDWINVTVGFAFYYAQLVIEAAPHKTSPTVDAPAADSDSDAKLVFKAGVVMDAPAADSDSDVELQFKAGAPLQAPVPDVDAPDVDLQFKAGAVLPPPIPTTDIPTELQFKAGVVMDAPIAVLAADAAGVFRSSPDLQAPAGQLVDADALLVFEADVDLDLPVKVLDVTATAGIEFTATAPLVAPAPDTDAPVELQFKATVDIDVRARSLVVTATALTGLPIEECVDLEAGRQIPAVLEAGRDLLASLGAGRDLVASLEAGNDTTVELAAGRDLVAVLEAGRSPC